MYPVIFYRVSQTYTAENILFLNEYKMKVVSRFKKKNLKRLTRGVKKYVVKYISEVCTDKTESGNTATAEQKLKIKMRKYGKQQIFRMY